MFAIIKGFSSNYFRDKLIVRTKYFRRWAKNFREKTTHNRRSNAR